ncbi:hypothetical protein EVC24_024 [Rhizobium phage RHph_I4]|nr:hypothetical protein EVC24_024 [Rhizobium phage RHph_I4]
MTEAVKHVAPKIESIFTSDPSKVRGLTEDEAKFLMQICLAAGANSESILIKPVKGSELEQHVTETLKVKMPFGLAVLVKRLAVMTPDIHYVPGIVVFLSSMCDNPAQCVMVAYSLYRETQRNNGLPVDEIVLCERLIPEGLPTEGHMESIWVSQKRDGRPDNWLDTRDAWA